MPDWSVLDRSHVAAALAEYDRLGSREFLGRYRFGHASAYTIWHNGQEYDYRAVLGVAYLHATGRVPTREEFRDGERSAAKVLESRGFDVVVDEQLLEQEEQRQAARATPAPSAPETAAASPAARKPAARKPAAKKAAKKPAERPVQVCPTCYTALPATGICDFCD